MKLNKRQLDRLASQLGLIAGIAGAIAANGIYPKFFGTMSAIALVFLGQITQRPATAHPTTEDVEQKA